MSGDEMRFSDRQLLQFTSDVKQFMRRADERHAELVDDVHKLREETRDAVQFHRDVAGVTRLGYRVQKFGLWLIKWPLIGAGLYAVWEWALKHLPQ